MKKNKTLISTLIVAFALIIGGISSSALTIQQKLLTDYGTQGTNNYPQVIISHESGNPNNTGYNALDNEVNYMTRRWNETWGNSENAHYFVGKGGQVIQLLPDRRVAFHAGTWANYNGIGIELARTNDRAQFRKDYESYVTLHRQLAIKYGIPLTLDDGAYRGIKSHLWISNNIWGDHNDPYNYLSSMGVSKSQFAKDLRNGVGSDSIKPTTPQTPSKPSTSNNKFVKGDKVTVVKAVQYGNGNSFYANGTYDVIEVSGARVVIGKGSIVTSAIHADNLKKVTANKPAPTKPSQTNGIKWYPEKATFTPYYNINVRYGASTKYGISGVIPPNYQINYDAVCQADGYVWIKYQSYSGTRYMAVRPIGGQAWGTFK